MKKLLLTIILLFSFNQSFGLEFGDIKYQANIGELYYNQYEITSEYSLENLYIGYFIKQSDIGIGRDNFNPIREILPLNYNEKNIDSQILSFMPLEKKVFDINVKDISDDYEGRTTNLYFSIYEKTLDGYKMVAIGSSDGYFDLTYEGKKNHNFVGFHRVLSGSDPLYYSLLELEYYFYDFDYVLDLISRLESYKDEVGVEQYSIDVNKVRKNIDYRLLKIENQIDDTIKNIRSQSDYYAYLKSKIKLKQKQNDLELILGILLGQQVSIAIESFPEYDKISYELNKILLKNENTLPQSDYSNYITDLNKDLKKIADNQPVDYSSTDYRYNLVSSYVVQKYMIKGFEEELDNLFDLLESRE